MKPTLERGFTIIELMVGVTVLAMLLAVAVPGFGNWTADARVRSTAEAIQNAVRLAQSTAVANSRPVGLALTNATPAWNATPAANGKNWFVRLLAYTDTGETADSSYYVQGASIGAQNGTTVTGPALLCFNSLGQTTAKASGETGLATACSKSADDASPNTYLVERAGGRSLKVMVYLGGRVRMCDTKKTLSNTHPDGCP